MSEQLAMPADCRLVLGFPGYCVSRDGDVWSRISATFWHKLTPAKSRKDGRMKVTLCSPGQPRTQVYVHLLVLTAFVGPRPDGMWGLHRDDDPTNNRLDNLRWGTPADNSADMIANGHHFTPFPKPPAVAPHQVEEIRRLHLAGSSSRAIAAALGLSKSTVWHIVARKGVYQEQHNVVPNL